MYQDRQMSIKGDIWNRTKEENRWIPAYRMNFEIRECWIGFCAILECIYIWEMNVHVWCMRWRCGNIEYEEYLGTRTMHL